MANFAEGKILDKKYEILELIGSGGMAYVYKARDIVADRFVAIKVLKREYCESEAYIKKFNNEAKAVNNLVHPNIVQVYDIGNVGNVHYIAREYVAGITLKDYIEKKGAIPWDEAMSITKQLLKAVEAAHAQHVIHRDIKPMNVLVTGDGTIKLSDFGIAKAVLGSTIQATKNSVGSVHYVSPEQARGGFVDERSDIYSIGVTLYEMIVGAVPFDGETHVSIALKHLSGTYVQPHDADPDIPMGVNDLVVMAMMKDPGSRFQSAADMLSRLERVVENPDRGFLQGYVPDDSDMKVVGSTYKAPAGNYSAEEEAESINPEDNIEMSVATPLDQILNQKKKKEIQKDKLLKIGSYAAGLAIAGLLVWFIVSTVAYVVDKSYILSKATYTLGDYKGYEAVDVIQMLEEEKIFVEQELVVDENYLGAGYIISQEPEAGKIMRKGDVVTFRVSAEEGSFLVPDVAGHTKDEAVAEFNLLGMITEVVQVKNNEVPAGQVVKTIPEAGAVVTKDDIMTVYVSEGELYNAITVPSLEGKTLAEARAELESLGLRIGEIYPEPEQNLTFIINPTASPLPTAAPTEKPTATPGPTASPTTDPESTENPWYARPSTTAIQPTPTVEPTPEVTEKPTREPTASPSPIPTVPPSEYIYASNTVQYQYPAAGTVLYANETVDLYFYDISSFKLDTIREYKTVVIPEPEDLGNKSSITFAVYARPNDTGKRETVYNKTIYTSLFPLTVKIPVSYNGGTNVSIYINNKLYYEYLSQ